MAGLVQSLQILHNYAMTAPESLRERRRRQTTNDIHAAALRLSRERGFDKVTIEQISVEAGVSPRTFFNYFPNKESAVIFRRFDFSADLAADFIAAGPAPYAVVLADVIALIARQQDESPPLRDEAQDVFALARSHPGVLAAASAQLDGFREQIAELVAQRIRMRADDEVPTLIAALALATVRVGLQRSTRDEPAGLDTPIRSIERAAQLVRSFFMD